MLDKKRIRHFEPLSMLTLSLDLQPLTPTIIKVS